MELQAPYFMLEIWVSETLRQERKGEKHTGVQGHKEKSERMQGLMHSPLRSLTFASCLNGVYCCMHVTELDLAGR